MARILIVDDDAAFRQSLAEMLQDLGHDVVECASTGAGLPASTNGFINFDVALSYLAAAPGPLVIVGGIDAANPATTATLAACTADPNHAHCFWHEIPSFAPCAAQYGDDGVYCDSFDTTIAP